MDKNLLEEIIKEQGNDNYRTEIDVSLSVQDLETGGDIKAVVEWQLGIELRSWGLKTLSPYFTTQPLVLEFEVSPIDVDVDVEPEPSIMKVEVDMSEVPKSYEEAGYMAPISLDLWLSKEGVVDYSRSSVNFAYISKEYF